MAAWPLWQATNRGVAPSWLRSCVAAKIWLGAKSKISLERAALRFKHGSCFESSGMLYLLHRKSKMKTRGCLQV